MKSVESTNQQTTMCPRASSRASTRIKVLHDNEEKVNYDNDRTARNDKSQAYVAWSRSKLEIKPFHLEHLAILQVALHDFKNGFGQAHTDEGILDLGEPMDLAELEE
jgi:hypothetical protein